MKVLITGAMGFVGQHLVTECLKRPELQLVLPTRHPFPHYWPTERVRRVEITDLNQKGIEALWKSELQQVDVVVHLAALAHVMNGSSDLYDQINAEGTKKLAEAAAKSGVKRFVFLSTIKVNGERTEPGAPFHEDSPPAPQDPYSVSKLKAENYIQAICQASQMEWTILRPPLIYALNAKGNIAGIRNFLEKHIPLPFGSIKNKRSLIDINELTKVVITCLDHPNAGNQLFLIANPAPITTTALIQRIARELNTQAILLPIPERLLRWLLILLGKKEMAKRLFDSLEINGEKARNQLS